LKLLFVHGGEKLKESRDGSLFTGGSYNQKVWDRYLSISRHLSVIFRKDPKIYNTEFAKQKFQLFDNTKMNFIKIPDLTVSFFSFLSIKKRKTTNRIIKNAVLEHDCLIARLPNSAGNIAVTMARKYNKPYLIELVGCPWDAFWNHSWKGKLVAPFMWYSTKKAVKNAPYVLYVTNEFLQRRYPNTGRTINCSDVALPILDESVLDARLHKIKQMTKYKPIVLGTTAAVDVRYKGQEYVIHAIAELNRQGYNYEYRLVGGGDKARLQSIAEKYGVADKVIFEGSIPHERVFDYLDSIDIYVQPSKTEGLPRALIEAMSRGCPCIGSNAGGIPELLDNYHIFSRGNVKELATILAGLDTEKMVKQAKRNFEFSKGYAKDVIETRRNEFFKQFAESVKNL
jgi:glycosyltransferase involved in cell wall biosynthesis